MIKEALGCAHIKLEFLGGISSNPTKIESKETRLMLSLLTYSGYFAVRVISKSQKVVLSSKINLNSRHFLRRNGGGGGSLHLINLF